MKILPFEAELFHADGRTDGYDAANSHLSQFYETLRNRRKNSFNP